jgi:hypothetical protein
MDFELQFKLATLLMYETRHKKLIELFEPKLNDCSLAYDSGDMETANAMLKFISEKLVELLED